MEEQSIPLTSFVIGDNQFEFLWMPFWLTNASRTFARAMMTLFDNCSDLMVIYGDYRLYTVKQKNRI